MPLKPGGISFPLRVPGAINAAELEHIIERALIQIDGRITLDDLKSLLEVAGFFDASSDGQEQTVH